MAAYRRVYDSRHLQADCQAGISSGTLRSVIEYGLPLRFIHVCYSMLLVMTTQLQQQNKKTLMNICSDHCQSLHPNRASLNRGT